ncbi:hypothetical protein BC938DRAFT_478170, partial [Jimgerdemannia flammicorona]
PFRAEDRVELLEEIKEAKFEFHERYWKGISDEAKNFIRALLNPDPDARLTADQALAHPWISGLTASDYDLLDSVRENFNARKKFRSAVEMVQALNSMKRASTRLNSINNGPAKVEK